MMGVQVRAAKMNWFLGPEFSFHFFILSYFNTKPYQLKRTKKNYANIYLHIINLRNLLVFLGMCFGKDASFAGIPSVSF